MEFVISNLVSQTEPWESNLFFRICLSGDLLLLQFFTNWNCPISFQLLRMSKNHKYPPSQNYTCQQKIRATVTVIFVPTHIHEDKFGFLVWLLKLFQYAWRQTGNSIKCSTCLTDTNTATGNIKNYQNSDNYPDIFFFYCNNVISYIELLEIHSSGIYLLFNEVLRLGVISAFVRDSANRCKNASISALNFAPTWPSYSFQVGVIRAIVTGAGNRLFDAPQWQERCQALQENSSSSFIRPM